MSTPRPNLSGPWKPVDYTTGPSVRQAVDQLDTGRPVPKDEPRKKYSRPTFAQVRAKALKEAGHAR